MQDHKAPKRPMTQGVTQSDHRGYVPETTGIIPGSLNAVPKNSEEAINEGIPFESFAYTPPKVGERGCRGNDGQCGAYPVKGTSLCYGHSRS